MALYPYPTARAYIHGHVTNHAALVCRIGSHTHRHNKERALSSGNRKAGAPFASTAPLVLLSVSARLVGEERILREPCRGAAACWQFMCSAWGRVRRACQRGAPRPRHAVSVVGQYTLAVRVYIYPCIYTHFHDCMKPDVYLQGARVDHGGSGLLRCSQSRFSYLIRLHVWRFPRSGEGVLLGEAGSSRF